jgi:two-component system cell cycle response regulator DivK
MSEPISILYVEDNADNRLLIRRILEAEGFIFLEAESAAEGLEVAQAQHPALILMDINLPIVDGLTLTSQLRAIPELSAIPILALTANVMKGDRERTLEAGCDGYIQKPIDVDQFTQLIHRYLNEVSRE